MEKETSSLTLKWGTLKGWDLKTDKEMSLLQEYFNIGASISGMMQQDTDKQKEIILNLIDLCTDPQGIFLDWDGKYVSKDKAKKYVMEYGKD